MRTAPISGLPEIGRIRCPSRLQPTWVPSCFETHRSAAGLWMHRYLPRAAMLLSMRATQRRLDEGPPAAVGNDRRLRSIVSGLLLTIDGATPTCRAVSAPGVTKPRGKTAIAIRPGAGRHRIASALATQGAYARRTKKSPG